MTPQGQGGRPAAPGRTPRVSCHRGICDIPIPTPARIRARADSYRQTCLQAMPWRSRVRLQRRGMPRRYAQVASTCPPLA
jgi:hypothetical protein